MLSNNKAESRNRPTVQTTTQGLISRSRDAVPTSLSPGDHGVRGAFAFMENQSVLSKGSASYNEITSSQYQNSQYRRIASGQSASDMKDGARHNALAVAGRSRQVHRRVAPFPGTSSQEDELSMYRQTADEL